MMCVSAMVICRDIVLKTLGQRTPSLDVVHVHVEEKWKLNTSTQLYVGKYLAMPDMDVYGVRKNEHYYLIFRFSQRVRVQRRKCFDYDLDHVGEEVTFK